MLSFVSYERVLLARLVHLAFLVAPVPRVTWVAPDRKVVKACKVLEERLVNPVFPVKLALLALLEKMVLLVTKVAKEKPELPALLVSLVLAVRPALPEARAHLVLKDILANPVLLV